MTSKEIIKRIVEHNNPPRIGFNFINPDYNDISFTSGRTYIDEKPNPYEKWGKYQELLEITGFSGEVKTDRYGNIYGRFDGKTKGECICGAIRDWSDFENYHMPKLDKAHGDRIRKMNFSQCDTFVMISGCSVFSALRDARLMSNALMDTVLEKDMVLAFCDMIATHEVEAAKQLHNCGIDGVMLCDDWGTQDRTFISPESFIELFKPAYKKIFDAYHEVGIKCFLHSCGYNYVFLDEFIDAGVDVFQFDQPDAYPSEVLAKEFGKKTVFHSPVDIQKVLPTGNRDIIEKRAYEMLELFKGCGGSWIAKDYPTYWDIGVEFEWAKWAEDIIVNNAEI